MISLRKHLVVRRLRAPQVRLMVHAVEFSVWSQCLSSGAWNGLSASHLGWSEPVHMASVAREQVSSQRGDEADVPAVLCLSGQNWCVQDLG